MTEAIYNSIVDRDILIQITTNGFQLSETIVIDDIDSKDRLIFYSEDREFNFSGWSIKELEGDDYDYLIAFNGGEAYLTLV